MQKDHYFCGAAATFGGEASHKMEAYPLTRNQTIHRGYQSQAYIDGDGTEDNEFLAKEHGVERVTALYKLKYWVVSAQNRSLLILLVFIKRSNMDNVWVLQIFVGLTSKEDDILTRMQ